MYKKYVALLASIILCNLALAKKCAVDFNVSMEFEPCKDNYQYKVHRQPLKEAKAFMAFLRALYKEKNLAELKPEKKPLIPKKIHQIWLGPNKPPAIFKQSQKSIKKYHPDWEYKLWTDADVPGLHLQNQYFYDQSKNYGERSDILRYEILYRYGGVYLDVDFVCLKPFDILNHTYTFYTSLMPLDCEDTLCNGMIASAPGHPILKDCIDTIKDDWYESTNLIIKVGPYHFQKSFWRVARTLDGKDIAFPKSYFFPLNYTTKASPGSIDCHIKPEAFAIHHWTHSWCKAKVKCNK